jgi:hypothetical protein
MLQGWNNRGFHFQLVKRNTIPGHLSKKFKRKKGFLKLVAQRGNGRLIPG